MSAERTIDHSKLAILLALRQYAVNVGPAHYRSHDSLRQGVGRKTAPASDFGVSEQEAAQYRLRGKEHFDAALEQLVSNGDVDVETYGNKAIRNAYRINEQGRAHIEALQSQLSSTPSPLVGEQDLGRHAS